MGNHYGATDGDNRTEADAVYDIAAAGFEIRDSYTGKLHVLVPKDHKVETFDPPTPILPDHIRQGLTFSTEESFCRYVKAWARPNSIILVDRFACVVGAVIDYHQPGDTTVMPAAHRPKWPMPMSLQWQKWTGIDGREMAQAPFAEFLEENIADVRDPAGARLLEVATNLSGKKTVDFGNAVRLQNGDVQFSYIEQSDAKGGGNLAVPEKIKLGIPVFYGGIAYEVPCFFRWRLNGGKLSFRVVMQQRQQVLDDALNAAALRVGEATGIPPLFGSLDP